MIPTLAAWLHDLSPFVVRFPAWAPIDGLRWYGLSYLAGFAVAYGLVRRVVRHGRSPLPPGMVGDMIVTLAVGTLIGGRLGYVLFYRPELLWTFYDHLPFWGVLAINEGGMASHGGMLGIIFAGWWFAGRITRLPIADPRSDRLPNGPTHAPGVEPSVSPSAIGHRPSATEDRLSTWGHILDLACFASPIGVFFGRLANFVNGELYGRACDPAYPLAVRFPQEMELWPSEKWRAFEALTGAGPGADERLGLWIDLARQGDQAVRSAMQSLLTARHPSQLYQAGLEGLALMGLMLWAYRRPRRPWLAAGLFCIGYAAARIVGEFFRMPDAHLLDREFAALHVTRGQWLSGLLMLLGVGLIVLSRRLPGPGLGGWRRGRSEGPPR